VDQIRALAEKRQDALIVLDEAYVEYYGQSSVELIGDRPNADRLLERALRLAASEQVRLPFLMEGSWVHDELQENPGLARAYRQLLNQGPPSRGGPAHR